MANILTLPENEEVLVVGTVYKDMKLKPSILDEYVKVSMCFQPCPTHVFVVGLNIAYLTLLQVGMSQQLACQH